MVDQGEHQPAAPTYHQPSFWIVIRNSPATSGATCGTSLVCAYSSPLPITPETDGQTERANHTMEQLICATCDDVADWEQQLPLIEFAYNNALSPLPHSHRFI
ncbi:hypothetical protein CLOM_g8866 [Closterium sp. NIES-68]|nr:hypothetical protein CLOM_g8866 [Closterium sp. NIES-68]